MGSTTRKYIAATVAASASQSIKKSHPKWMTMNREKLYTVLEENGYYWDMGLQTWVIREAVDVRTRKGVSGIEAVVSPSAKTFLVRIMCAKTDADVIEKEFAELSEALGWSVERSGKEYQNSATGAWVRRYYKVERGE